MPGGQRGCVKRAAGPGGRPYTTFSSPSELEGTKRGRRAADTGQRHVLRGQSEILGEGGTPVSQRLLTLFTRTHTELPRAEVG